MEMGDRHSPLEPEAEADEEQGRVEGVVEVVEAAEHDAVVVLRPPLGRVRLHRADEPGVVPERDGR